MSEHTIERQPMPGRQPMSWAAHGMCASADPELFFPDPGADASEARAICRACPVRRICLDYALDTHQKFGIWGGMTENQRRRLRRDRDDHPARPVALPAEPAPSPVAGPGRHLHLVR